MSFIVDACVAQHPGDRKEQQDRSALLPHPREPGVLLAVVADGMGGHSGGALAAQQVIHTCANNLERYSPRSESPSELLCASLAEAHLLIRASRFINEKDPHSTAVSLLVEPERASWAHCGDSRLYFLRGERVVAQTRDHSYVEQLVANGRITAEQALAHPQRNVLTTSLGGDCEPRIDFAQTADLRCGAAFLLCSDGLWTYFGAAELGAVIATHPASEACAILLERARQRAQGEGDNATLIVVKLNTAPAPDLKPTAVRRPG